MKTIIIRFEVSDVEHAKEVMQRRADVLRRLTEQAQGHGMVSHSFHADGRQTIYALDTWRTEGGFHDFFDGNQEIRTVLDQAGILKEPEITVLEPMDAPGTL